MSTQSNKALVHRVFDMINSKNLDAADEVFAADYVYSTPGAPELRGPEGFKQVIQMYLTAFPDLQMTTLDVIAEDDVVVSHWSATGTHQGDLMGIAATGKQVTIQGMVKSRVAAGKIVEDLEISDALGMLQQVGAAPAPAGAMA